MTFNKMYYLYKLQCSLVSIAPVTGKRYQKNGKNGSLEESYSLKNPLIIFILKYGMNTN